MNTDTPKPTILGKLVILAFVAACVYGAWIVFQKSGRGVGPSTEQVNAVAASPTAGVVPAARPAEAPTVELGFAYGTEKKRWIEDAVEEFAKSPGGRGIRVTLYPLGSLEAAQAILRGDTKIHAWSPASALYKDTFVSEWSVKNNGKNPILKEEQLALTPMVFVTWAERSEAFLKKYNEVTFVTVAKALAERGGWSGIAEKPEWGLFKFGHTHPNESNSGLATLLLMAYDFTGKTRDLTLKDIVDPKFQDTMVSVENAVSGMSSSTGNMMKEMVLKGPSSYDSLFVYESVAIDFMKNAEGRWGELRVSYPKRNLWNDNPCYILDVPWSTPEQRKAADQFMKFLLSAPVQQKSIVHGFRPANPQVPVRSPGSPFVDYEKYGIKQDIGQTCDIPKAEVINNLLQMWQRSRQR